MDRHGGRHPVGASGGRDGAGAAIRRAGGRASRRRRSARRTRRASSPTKDANLANSQTQVDIALFIQWVEADLNDDEVIADFYLQAVPGRVQAGVPRMAPDGPVRGTRTAPDSPFAMPQYVLTARPWMHTRTRSDPLTRTAETAQALRASGQTNYVLGVVLFAVALFFAGISSKLPRPGLRFDHPRRRTPWSS